MARLRTKPPGGALLSGGTAWDVWFDGSHVAKATQRGIHSTEEYIWDTVHSGPPYLGEDNLDKAKTTIVRRGKLTIRSSNTGRRRTLNWDPGTMNTSHMDTQGPVGVQHYVNQALARANPNVPIVDLPMFLFELRELPRMLRDLGKLLQQPKRPDIPGSYLAYQFGWRPLFNDLNSLLSLGKEIEEVRSRIDKIAARRTFSGSFPTMERSWTGHTRRVSFNTGENFEFTDSWKGTREVWFSARAKADYTAPYFGEDRFDSINRSLGLNASAQTVWNLIPWSFLIDYFANVSTYLGATRGVLPLYISNMNIMCRDVTTVTQSLSSSPDIDFDYTSGVKETVRKRRWVYAVPHARISLVPNPMVSKLGVLSALAAKQFYGLRP